LVFNLIFNFGVGAVSIEGGEIKPQLRLVRHPIFRNIQKEMLRLRDMPQPRIKESVRKNYRAWLALEDYFLYGGLSHWSLKILTRLIGLRDKSASFDKKAIYECQSWRIVELEVRNRNKPVWDKIEERGYGEEDYERLKHSLSQKVRECVSYVGEDYQWLGPKYPDRALDIKARLTVESGEKLFLLSLEKEKPKE